MDLGAASGALGGAIGGIVGNIAAGGDQDRAAADQAAALAAIQGVNIPTVQEMQWALQNYQNAGSLSPALTQILQANPTAYNNIKIDPRALSAQMSALQSLQDQSHMGLSQADRQALQEITNQTNGQAQAQNASIMQNMAQRGMAGGGAELAARLSASQNASNQANMQGMSVAAQAQRNALNALSQYGALGSQVRGQDYQQAADAAHANDYINMFNTQNAQNVGNQNTGIQNNAQLYNLQNKQNIMNANTGIANQQDMHNTGLYQQVYQDQMQKAGALAGQYGINSNYYNNQAAGTRGMWAGVGSGVGQAMGGGVSGGGGAPSSGGGAYSPELHDQGGGSSNPFGAGVDGSLQSGGMGAAGAGEGGLMDYASIAALA